MSKKKSQDLGVLGTILMAEWWSKGGHADFALGMLLSSMKASAVITGGRPKWAPPQRSSAMLRVILGGKYLSVADIKKKYGW